MYFHLKSIGISFINEITRVDKTTTVANDTYIYTFHHLVLYLNKIHPGRPGLNFPYEQTNKFVPGVTTLI